MLNKLNLAVAQFASTEESRYTLSAIQVTPQATVATDGHRLVWVATDSTKSDHFPVVPGMPAATSDTFAPFLLLRDSALRIAKVTPTKDKMPILNHVGVTTPETDGKLTPVLAVTNLKSPQVFPVEAIPGTFPNWQAVIPKFEEAEFRICLSAKYLAEIAKFAAEFGERTCPVLLSFYGEKNAMRFDAAKDGQGMTAVLMPMALAAEPDVAGTYGYAERRMERAHTEALREDADREQRAAA